MQLSSCVCAPAPRQTEERNATERTKVQAATLYWQLGGWANLDRAKDMLDEVLQVQPSYPQAQNLKAWIELALEEEEAEATGGIDRALSIFNQVRRPSPPSTCPAPQVS